MAMDNNGGCWIIDAYTTTIRYMSPWLASLMPILNTIPQVDSLPPGLLPIVLGYLDPTGYGNLVQTYPCVTPSGNDQPLLDCNGIAIDQYGYIFVSSRHSHRIYRLTDQHGKPPSRSPAVPLTPVSTT
jgi:hypothetical protein